MFKRYVKNPFSKDGEISSGSSLKTEGEFFNTQDTNEVGYSIAGESAHRLFDIRNGEAIKMGERGSNTVLQFNTNQPMEKPETTIGHNVSFKGELSFQRLLQVDGHFEGTLQTSAGTLIIGETGSVAIEQLTLPKIIIHGCLEGSVIANYVILKSTAKMHGDITTDRLIVEEGAILEGTVKITPPSEEKSVPDTDEEPQQND